MLIFFRALASPARGSRLLPLLGKAGGPRARCWGGCFLLRAERGDRPVCLVCTYHAAVMHGLVGLSVCLLSLTECKFPPRGSRCQRPGPFTARCSLIPRRAHIFSHSSVDGRWVVPTFLAIASNAAVNTGGSYGNSLLKFFEELYLNV